MAEVDGNSSQPMPKELPEGFGHGVSEEQAQELKRLLEEIEMYQNVCLPELCHSWLGIFGFKRFILRKDQPILISGPIRSQRAHPKQRLLLHVSFLHYF
jgi:hypothetical protein